MEGKIDELLGKWASRKLMVWATATACLATGTVTSDNWVAISLVYIGTQAAVDLASKWKHGK